MARKTPDRAPFDYGHGDPSKLRSFKIKAYDFTSASETDVRQTSGYADNAMKDASAVNETATASDLDRLREMLNGAGITDDEIKNGVDLEPRGYHKVAAALGCGIDHVKSLLASLVKEVGAQGGMLAEKGSVANSPKPSIIDEIKEDTGTMDFPWSLGARKGVATAVYKADGKKFYIKVPHIFDQYGQPVEVTPEERNKIRQQGIQFIGNE